jgi:hypothetical protein
LGIAQTKLGKYTEARSNLRMALIAWRNLNNGSEQANVHHALGFLAFKQGSVARALRWYNKALSMTESIPVSPAREMLVKSLKKDIAKALSSSNDSNKAQSGH